MAPAAAGACCRRQAARRAKRCRAPLRATSSSTAHPATQVRAPPRVCILSVHGNVYFFMFVGLP